MSEIRRANATYGIYDLHIEVEVKTTDDLDVFVFDKMRKIPGVKETVTMITSEAII